MPDGTLMTEIPNERLAAHRDLLVDYSKRALDRTVASLDLEQLPVETRAELRERFAGFARELMNDAATVTGFQLDEAAAEGERFGEARAKEAMLTSLKVVSGAAAAMKVGRAVETLRRPSVIPGHTLARSGICECGRDHASDVENFRASLVGDLAPLVGHVCMIHSSKLISRGVKMPRAELLIGVARALGRVAGAALAGIAASVQAPEILGLSAVESAKDELAIAFSAAWAERQALVAQIRKTGN